MPEQSNENRDVAAAAPKAAEPVVEKRAAEAKDLDRFFANHHADKGALGVVQQNREALDARAANDKALGIKRSVSSNSPQTVDQLLAGRAEAQFKLRQLERNGKNAANDDAISLLKTQITRQEAAINALQGDIEVDEVDVMTEADLVPEEEPAPKKKRSFLERAEGRGQQTIDTTKQNVQSGIDSTKRGAKAGTEKVKSFVASDIQETKDRQRARVESAKEKVGAAKSTVRGWFEKAKAGVRGFISDVSSSVRSSVDTAKMRAGLMYKNTKEAVTARAGKVRDAAMDAALSGIGVAYIGGKAIARKGAEAYEGVKSGVKKGAEFIGAGVDAVQDGVVRGSKIAIGGAVIGIESIIDLGVAVKNKTVEAGQLAVGVGKAALEGIAGAGRAAKESFMKKVDELQQKGMERKDALVAAIEKNLHTVAGAVAQINALPAKAKKSFFEGLANAIGKIAGVAQNAAERASNASEKASEDAQKDVDARTAAADKDLGAISSFMSRFKSTRRSSSKAA